MKVHRRSGDHIRRPQTSTSFGGISASQIMQNRGSLWPFLKGSVLPFLDRQGVVDGEPMFDPHFTIGKVLPANCSFHSPLRAKSEES